MQPAADDPRYAPTNLAELFLREGRKRTAVSLLVANGQFPTARTEILEVGVGRMGWLPDFLCWGVPPERLHGIDVDPARVDAAQKLFPNADLRIGDASMLPWESATFDLVVASTLFTSLLDQPLRVAVAQEIARVLRPQGAVLFHDFVVNNPRNPHVRKVTLPELQGLFPGLRIDRRSACLAPPLARAIAPRARWLAALLEAIPFLRTHLVAVLTKPR
jgi:SAM-dependent methyltransferase